MPYDTGPIVIESLPLGPRVSLPAAFEGLAAEFPFIGSSVDQALATHAQTLAPYVNRDIDPSFMPTLAAALEGLGAINLASDAQALADVHAAIDSVVDDFSTQRADLPGPDEPEPQTVTLPHDGDPGEPTGTAVPRPPAAPGPTPTPTPGPEPTPTPAPGPLPFPTPTLPPPGAHETQVRAAIRALYLELLFREPDPGGWDSWTQQVLGAGHTFDWVRARFLETAEYHALHDG